MNKDTIVGREYELKMLNRAYESKDSQLVVITGRRRVGKTYLVNNAFEGKFTFKLTGSYGDNKEIQLHNFAVELAKRNNGYVEKPTSWSDAFLSLEKYLDSIKTSDKILVFFDEMPWLDNQKSGFLKAFEYFWNSYGSSKRNLMFIVCGSSTSWISDKILKNRGGLFNRYTLQLFLKPFTLKETKQFLLSKNIRWSDYDIAQIYMIMGGIPFYLMQLDESLSLGENVDNMFFKKQGLLWNEFNNLYQTLFANNAQYIKIVEALANKRSGLSRNEIAKITKIPYNGVLSKMLSNLVDSDFISPWISYREKKETVYRLTDFYTSFYFKYIKENYANDEHYWASSYDEPSRKIWLAYSFELLCFLHVNEIKQALGISGVSTKTYAYYKKGDAKSSGVQIDLIIERRDKVIDLIEIKYASNEFEIDKKYDLNLRNKIEALTKLTNGRKSIRLVFITTYGVKRNEYSNIVNKSILLSELIH